MATRNRTSDNRSPSESSNPAEQRDETDSPDHLPMRSRRSMALADAPKKGLKLVVERGASVYFSACRRVAEFLNDRD